MRLLGQILLACLLIAVLQGILAVIAIGIVLALIVGLIWRPAETIGLLIVLGLITALQTYPWMTIGVSLAIVCVLLIAGKRLPADPSEPPPIALPPPGGRAD